MAPISESRILHRLPERARVAIFRPGRIGDLICATPALRALRRAAPTAWITFIGLPLVAPLVGRTSLDELAAVIGALDLLVAADSGPAHLAYALGTPTVTGFLTSDPHRWGPPDLPRHVPVVLAAAGDSEVCEAACGLLSAGRPAFAERTW